MTRRAFFAAVAALLLSLPLFTPSVSNAGPDDRWFVICGSYPDNRNDLAMQHLANLQQVAPDAMVIHTTGYHNLRDGLLAVVIGPYSQGYAMQRLQQIKPMIPDAYVKAGW